MAYSFHSHSTLATIAVEVWVNRVPNAPGFNKQEVHNLQKWWLATVHMSQFDVNLLYCAVHEALFTHKMALDTCYLL